MLELILVQCGDREKGWIPSSSKCAELRGTLQKCLAEMKESSGLIGNLVTNPFVKIVRKVQVKSGDLCVWSLGDKIRGWIPGKSAFKEFESTLSDTLMRAEKLKSPQILVTHPFITLQVLQSDNIVTLPEVKKKYGICYTLVEVRDGIDELIQSLRRENTRNGLAKKKS